METELGISNLNRNDESTASGDFGSIEDIIARGAVSASATESETAPDPGDVQFVDKPKRGRKTKAQREAEEAEAAAAAELEVFFSPQGIGAVWTNGINAFYVACGAEPLTAPEADMHAKAFATWARYRLPANASKYQPDLLLAATLAMTTLPRMQPIAKTTVPFWRRVVAKFRRRKVTPGNA
jgi:hypothetical protein